MMMVVVMVVTTKIRIDDAERPRCTRLRALRDEAGADDENDDDDGDDDDDDDDDDVMMTQSTPGFQPLSPPPFKKNQ